MKFDEVVSLISLLAESQGYYGRILRLINAITEAEFEIFKSVMEEQQFTDALDVIMYFET